MVALATAVEVAALLSTARVEKVEVEVELSVVSKVEVVPLRVAVMVSTTRMTVRVV